MTKLDYWVLAGYFVVSVGIGVWFLHRVAGRMKNLSQFFLSGRSLPWWLLGTSMVATTFAADTPILASRMVAEFGLYFSWMVLPLLLTATLTTFFFARLWRRSAVLTDVEYLELRYPGASGRFLRGFKALYLGFLINSLIIGTQLIAIGEIGEHVMGIDKNTAMFAGAGIALLPQFLTGRDEELGKLVRVLPEWHLAGSALHVVYPSARYVPQRVVVFRDHLIRELTKLSSRCEERTKLARG